MWPGRVSNPGPPTYESGALPIALRGPAKDYTENVKYPLYNGQSEKLFTGLKYVFVF